MTAGVPAQGDAHGLDKLGLLQSLFLVAEVKFIQR